MTPEQRQKLFIDELTVLQQRYGFQVGAQVQTRQLGPVVQCEPVVAILAIEGWQEPPESDEHDNGKLPPPTVDEIAEVLERRGRKR